MINWEKSDMVLNFYPSQVFFSKHIFHLDIIKGSKETDEVKRKGLFLVPAAPAQFLYTFFFKHYFENENDVKAKNSEDKSFLKSIELVLLFYDK